MKQEYYINLQLRREHKNIKLMPHVKSNVLSTGGQEKLYPFYVCRSIFFSFSTPLKFPTLFSEDLVF